MGVTDNREDFSRMLDLRTGIISTDEQLAFYEDFQSPLLSFSLPGTGKTTTAVKGLIVAERFDKIPGNKIYATSFTREAYGDMKFRHGKFCKLFGASQNVKFSTLHALCRSILVENYELLDWQKPPTITKTAGAERMKDLIEELCAENEFSIKPGQSKKIWNAITSMNSSFVFDLAHLQTRMAYCDAEIDFLVFKEIRQQIYFVNLAIGVIPEGEIPLYTLDLLYKHPEIGKDWRENRCKLLLIDEFQDSSLLQLSIARQISDNIVAIGDINQQIYNFNGACQEIVERFGEYFPGHRVANLTQSFRCAKAIASFAAPIIKANRTNGENIKGVEDREGHVEVTDDPQFLRRMVDRIAAEWSENGHFLKHYMFMYRNNLSSFKVIDMLYEAKVPVLTNKHKKMQETGGDEVKQIQFLSLLDMPIITDLKYMISFLENPTERGYLKILSKFIPEFSKFETSDMNPLYKPMYKTGGSFMSINYNYREGRIVARIMEIFEEVIEMLAAARPVVGIFEKLFPIYDHCTFKYRAPWVDYKWETIIGIIREVAGNRSFGDFVARENDKDRHMLEAYRNNIGVKCITFHGAKGLEADVCIILDAEASIIPSKKHLDQALKMHCDLDAAREIRNERSLCYVACTRAKEELYINYKERLAPMFRGDNAYVALDEKYRTARMEYADAEAFKSFIRNE